MDKQEIDEMENITKIIRNCIAECQQLKSYCSADDMAVYLYNTGYGNVEHYEREIARLNLVIQARDVVVNGLRQEIVKLKEDREKCINALSDRYTFKTTQDGVFCNVFDIVRERAVKEFAEKVKHDMYMKSIIQSKGCDSPDLYTDDMEKVIDNLLKEYGEQL